MPADKIFCSNCKNCLVVRKSAIISNQYLLRIHCQKDKWKKKIGEIKYYKYFTAARRSIDFCNSYEPMGDDEKEYIRELRKSLPIKDEVYSYGDESSSSN